MNSAGLLRVAVKADKYWKTVVLLYIILLAVREAEFVYGPKRIFANGPAVEGVNVTWRSHPATGPVALAEK